MLALQIIDRLEFIHSKNVNYCRNLKFEEAPDYNYLKNLFNLILIKNHLKNDLIFFWNQNRIIFGKKQSLFNIRKRKESSQKRLFKKVKLSLEKEGNPKKLISLQNTNNTRDINNIITLNDSFPKLNGILNNNDKDYRNNSQIKSSLNIIKNITKNKTKIENKVIKTNKMLNTINCNNNKAKTLFNQLYLNKNIKPIKNIKGIKIINYNRFKINNNLKKNSNLINANNNIKYSKLSVIKYYKFL